MIDHFVRRKSRLPVWCLALVALVAGCGPATPEVGSSSSERPKSNDSVRVLVVDDQELAKKLEEQWRARFADDDLQIRTAQRAELAEAKRLSADVVIFPAARMGQLAERGLIQPLPEPAPADSSPQSESESLPRVQEFLPTIRQCDASWGRKVYAVPLGSPQLVLLYRPDIFERLQLLPPETWDDYQQVSAKLADRAALENLAPPEDQPWHGTLEPLADGWAGTMLLARAASAVRTEGQLYSLFDVDDMAARIAEPPYVRAAQELAAAAKEFRGRRLTPTEVWQAFLAGECAMAITWPSAKGSTESKVPVAFTELPGRSQWYHFEQQEWISKGEGTDGRASLCAISGRMAAVTREARRSRSAFQFLAWLTSDDTAQALGPTNPHTTLFAQPQLDKAQSWVGPQVRSEAATQYADVVKSAFGRAAWMPAVRIPGVDDYNAALEKAVVEVLDNPDSAQSALQAAAEEWNAVTKRHSLQNQRRAYQRSLGNDF